MSYFSRFSLDLNNASALEILGMASVDPYKEHQFLWECFPSDRNATRDFIFRRESAPGNLKYFVVSEREPRAIRSPWLIETKLYDPRPRKGELLFFSLRVNPVVTKRDANGRQKRHDVVMDAKLRLNGQDTSKQELIASSGAGWLRNRAEKLGFEVDENFLQVDRYQQIKAMKRQSKAIQLSTLDLSGRLQVLDSDSFRSVLTNGIGPAKAFGCGLLLVRRG